MIEFTELTQEDIDEHIVWVLELGTGIITGNIILDMIDRFQATFSFQKAQSE